ncbi:hypothetical protein NPIL_192781, partial [Nephila pilipes]
REARSRALYPLRRYQSDPGELHFYNPEISSEVEEQDSWDALRRDPFIMKPLNLIWIPCPNYSFWEKLEFGEEEPCPILTVSENVELEEAHFRDLLGSVDIKKPLDEDVILPGNVKTVLRRVYAIDPKNPNVRILEHDTVEDRGYYPGFLPPGAETWTEAQGDIRQPRSPPHLGRRYEQRIVEYIPEAQVHVGSQPGRAPLGTHVISTPGRVPLGTHVVSTTSRAPLGTHVISTPGRVPLGTHVVSTTSRAPLGTHVVSTPARSRALYPLRRYQSDPGELHFYNPEISSEVEEQDSWDALRRDPFIMKPLNLIWIPCPNYSFWEKLEFGEEEPCPILTVSENVELEEAHFRDLLGSVDIKKPLDEDVILPGNVKTVLRRVYAIDPKNPNVRILEHDTVEDRGYYPGFLPPGAETWTEAQGDIRQPRSPPHLGRRYEQRIVEYIPEAQVHVGSQPGRAPLGTHVISTPGRVPLGTHVVSTTSRAPLGTHVISTPGRVPLGTHVVSTTSRAPLGTHVISTPGRVPLGTHVVSTTGRAPLGTHV